jgi:hypothetical protein
MRPILYYGVIRVWGGFEVIGVTTERGRQVYGRRADESSTHVAARDVIAKLPDQQSALSFMAKAGRIKAKHRPKIKEAERELTNAKGAEQRELEALVAAVS